MKKLFFVILYTFLIISLGGCQTVSKKIEDTTSKESKKFNIQVSDKLYAKYNLEKLQLQSLIDSKLLSKGEKYSDLPTIFMQFILE